MNEIDRLGENITDIEDFKFNERELSTCVYLNLHCNQLHTLHNLPYTKLNLLLELNLSSNNFTSCHLPELSFLPLLKILDLSANKLNSVVDLPFLPGLDSLSIAYNSIRSIDGLDENTPNLISLNVSRAIANTTADINVNYVSKTIIKVVTNTENNIIMLIIVLLVDR